MEIKRLYLIIVATIIVTCFPLFLTGCEGSKLRFLVCPHKFAKQIKSQKDLAAKREVLFNADEYSLLVVERSPGGEVEPAQHYRPQHTFSDKVLPQKVSWEEPLHISTIVIVEESPEIGIAIKIDGEKWRVHWIATPEIEELKSTGMLFLPPYNELPILNSA